MSFLLNLKAMLLAMTDGLISISLSNRLLLNISLSNRMVNRALEFSS